MALQARGAILQRWQTTLQKNLVSFFLAPSILVLLVGKGVTA